MKKVCIALALAMLALAAPVPPAQTTPQETARFYHDRQEVTPTYVTNVLEEFALLKGYQEHQEHRRNLLHARTPGNFQFTFSSHHIQGVARLPQSNCVVLSGNPSDQGRVAIVQLGTLAERSRGVLGNNERPPNVTDTVVKVITLKTLNSSYQHAGGMSTSGNIVAVPIERTSWEEGYPVPVKHSEIRFLFVPPENCGAAYDLYDDYPNARIVRSSYGAGAVAITRLPVGPFKDHYLVGVITGGDKRIWFYLSNTTEIVDGFHLESLVSSDWFQHGGWWLQSINFITQPDGRIYLLGTGNSHYFSDGDDNAFLAHVDFPGNDPRFEPNINGQNQIHFMCDDKYGNFNAGAGAYVGPHGKLALYASPHSTYSESGKGGGEIIHMHEFPWRPITMPLPESQLVFAPGPSSAPVLNADPAQANPMGLGSVATGGDTLDIKIGTIGFSGPADVYFAIFSPQVLGNEIFLLSGDTLLPLSSGLVSWIANTTGPLDEDLFGAIPISDLPSGAYTLYFALAPAGSPLATFYLWPAAFTVP